MDDDALPKRKRDYEIGMALDDLSIEELEERIEIMQSEIERLRAAIEAKSQSRQAAENVFKF